MSERHPTHFPPFPELAGVEIRHCPGLPGYAVGNDGSVWSCRRRGPVAGKYVGRWREMRVSRPKNGRYLHAGVSAPDGRGTRLVHRLVLEAFVGPCPPGMECCHYDGDKTNNRLENLRWDTKLANAADSIRLGAVKDQRGERNAVTRLTDECVMRIRDEYARGVTGGELASRYGVSRSAVSNIVNGGTWDHLPLVPSSAPRRRHRRCKLTADAVTEIRRLRAAGVKLRDVAERYGVTMATVSYIARGDTWKHVPDPGKPCR